MLNRVCIQGYKSFDRFELTLQPLTVLFGPNASGKSNLLDALQLLSRLGTSKTVRDAFAPPHRGEPLHSFRFGRRGVADLLDMASVSLTVEADVTLSDATVESVNQDIRNLRARPDKTGGDGAPARSWQVRERDLRYRVTVELTPATGVLRIADEYLAALAQGGEPSGSRKPFIERVGDRLRLRTEGQAHPTYHDRYLDHTVLSMPLYAPHYPHVVAMRRELEGWLFFYLEPRERMRRRSPVAEVRHIGAMGDDLPSFLNTLQADHLDQFRAVEKALSAVVPSVRGLKVAPNKLGQVELVLVEDDAEVPVETVSEGTLRVLGLLALCGAHERPSLIGFEEPENGIHPRRLEHVARLLESRAHARGTQILVTTHSPLLPDLVPNKSLYACRKRSGVTAIEHFVETGMFRPGAIADALDDDAVATTPMSERILRGDFDG